MDVEGIEETEWKRVRRTIPAGVNSLGQGLTPQQIKTTVA
jgi:hypothetical protein